MKRFFLASLLLLSFFVSSSFSSPTEEELKTAFVYNFLKFVSWPKFLGDTLHLCVVGKTALKSYLPALNGRFIKNRVLKVTVIEGEPLSSCQALFVGSLSSNKLKFLLEEAKHESVLTISDLPGFLKNGGIIEIFQVNNRLAFGVNLIAARKSGLKLSSRLLKLAKMVITYDNS